MKHKNKIFGVITFTLFLLVLTSISAQNFLPHKIDTNLNLIISSNNATACNVTYIQYPDASMILVNLNMTKTQNDFNYSIASGNFSSLGNICIGITCTDGSTNEQGSVCRSITPNGVVQSTAQGIGSAIYLGLMMVLTFLFGWIGFKLSESEKLWVLGIFFLFLAVLFMVYDVWLGYDYHRNFTGATDSGMQEIIFYIFLFLLIAGLVVSAFLLFTHWEQLVKMIKGEIADRKFKLEDDEIDRSFKNL